jgi:uncharacterized protein
MLGNKKRETYMRLDDLDPSSNAQDHGIGGGGGFSMGGGGGGMGSLIIGLLPLLLGRKMGCGTIAILAIGAALFFGSGMLNFSGTGNAPGNPAQRGKGDNVLGDTAEEAFALRVLTSTENVWGEIFAQSGQRYQPTKLNFFQQGTQSGCGSAQSAMGPFYCPADQGVYLDTSFFQQLDQMTGGQKNDFAYAYVIAHEVGHHIQNITGTADKVRQLQGRVSQTEGNQLQVRMELQADCYAGVWAARTGKDNTGQARLEAGDVEEGMRAANAIGDDTLMKSAGRAPVESMFTHGSSEQRMQALQAGLKTGDPRSCNYFKGIF